jgi:hypothetical protein
MYEAGFSSPFFAGTHWALPVAKSTIDGMASMFADPNSYDVDGRAVMFSVAYFSAKHLGTGQFYLLTIRDAAGQSLSGNNTYRLTVPAKAPVKLYWSATAYDAQTHALIRNNAKSSLASNDTGVQKNADGSVDIYFAPTAPAGKESNWVPTGRDFEVLFRFYGPLPPLFDHSWTMPDLVQVR